MHIYAVRDRKSTNTGTPLSGYSATQPAFHYSVHTHLTNRMTSSIYLHTLNLQVHTYHRQRQVLHYGALQSKQSLV